MIKKRMRLRAAEVKETMKMGRLYRSAGVSVKFFPEKGAFRAAVVVSKSIARGAVERNRIRRALYRSLPHTSLPHGRAVFFIQKTPTNLAQEVTSLLTKLH